MSLESIVAIVIFSLIALILIVIMIFMFYIYLTIKDIRALLELFYGENKKELRKEKIIELVSDRFGLLAPIAGLIIRRIIKK